MSNIDDLLSAFPTAKELKLQGPPMQSEQSQGSREKLSAQVSPASVTWEVVPGTPDLFIVEIPEKTTFRSYFMPAEQTGQLVPFLVRRFRRDESGEIVDDTGGSSVAHGNAMGSSVGGDSQALSTYDEGRIYLYQIDLLEGTAPQAYNFYVKREPYNPMAD